MKSSPKYFLVEASMLPEIFLKVVEAKELLQSGKAVTVAEAVNAVGISRSAFYKYKDFISAFHDLQRGRIITFHILLRDEPGLLSSLLQVFAASRANILSINQSIPVSGCATVTISAETTDMTTGVEELLQTLLACPGVVKAEVPAG